MYDTITVYSESLTFIYYDKSKFILVFTPAREVGIPGVTRRIQARTEGREREIKDTGRGERMEIQGEASETRQKYPQNGPNIELRN